MNMSDEGYLECIEKYIDDKLKQHQEKINRTNKNTSEKYLNK